MIRGAARHQRSQRASIALVAFGVLIASGSGLVACGDDERSARVVVLNPVDVLTVEVDGLVEGLAELDKNVEVSGVDVIGEDGMDAAVDAAIAAAPDVVVTFSTAGAVAFHERESGIPHVFAAVNDPLASGLIDDYLEPGESTTGVGGNTTNAKALEYLVQITGVDVVGVLIDRDDPGSVTGTGLSMAAAAELGIEAVEIDVDPAAPDAVALPPELEGLLLPGNNRLTPVLAELERLAADSDLPLAIAVAGADPNRALLTVEVDREQRVRRLIELVIAVLEGEDPGQIPVVVPENRLILNVRRATESGYEVPPSLLVLAADVIE